MYLWCKHSTCNCELARIVCPFGGEGTSSLKEEILSRLPFRLEQALPKEDNYSTIRYLITTFSFDTSCSLLEVNGTTIPYIYACTQLHTYIYVSADMFLAGARQEDPNAPRPVGPAMQPAVGVPLESRQEWHRNLEAAILHHSTVLAKQPAISVVDPHGKVSVALTYGGLLSIVNSSNRQFTIQH